MHHDSSPPALGDLAPEVFRQHVHALSDWAADFLRDIAQRPVFPATQPGDVVRALPGSAPEQGEDLGLIQRELEALIVPNLTQWNHPRNHAYFNSSASAPGILAELAVATLNNQGMLWHSGPAATELEQVTLGWLRQALGLPADHWGIIYDTASVAVLHALAAARERAFPAVRAQGPVGYGGKRPRVYASELAHSSVAKACIALGLGLESLRLIAVDEAFALRPEALAAAIAEDEAAGWAPFCVVSTIGTTSCTSVDPTPEILRITAEKALWHHVDAAHGGALALVPEQRHLFAGWELADSISVNPHKWMFVPMDCAVLYTRHPDVLKQAFSLVAEYLVTPQTEVTNYMDYGIQLGRRFRSLKLWYVMRAFGTAGLAARLRDHVASAQWFAQQVDATPGWERLAPVPMSTVCFRATWPGATEAKLDARNERLLQHVLADGRMFLSHTKLKGRYTLRMVVSQLNTQLHHVQQAWTDLQAFRAQIVT